MCVHLPLFCPKTQNPSLIFFIYSDSHRAQMFFLLLSFMYYYVTLLWFIMLRSATDVPMMLKLLYFLLSRRALRKKNFFLIMICCHVFLSIRLWSHFLFSFNCVPIKTTWEQEIMGNNIFLVLSFCGKQLWCYQLDACIWCLF